MRRTLPLRAPRQRLGLNQLSQVISPGTDYRMTSVRNHGFQVATEALVPQTEPALKTNTGTSGEEVFFVWAQTLKTFQVHLKNYDAPYVVFAKTSCGIGRKSGSSDWTKPGTLPADSDQYYLVLDDGLRAAAKVSDGALRAALHARNVDPKDVPP
jgi:hypothetical protein